MTTFDAREKAFEDKFAHDANRQFEALARRNRLTGRWACELLGLTGGEAAAYVKAVSGLFLADGKSDQVFLKIKTDFAQHDIQMSDADLIRTMADHLKQVMHEPAQDGRS